MNVLKKIILTFTVIISANLLFAQNPIYLEISDCTKEFKYSYTEPNGVNSGYVAYQFVLNDYETVILETSTYDSKIVSNNSPIATSRISCSESLQKQLPVETIEKIQDGKQDVYLLKPNSNGFTVLSVTDATYQVYLPYDKYLRVVARAYEFDYDGKKEYETGAVLKTAGEGDFVLFDEASIDCYDKPTFMHVPLNFMETANIEYILGVGVVRQYSDLMEHRLLSIDGQPIQQYLTTFCNKDFVETETIPELHETSVAEEVIENTTENTVLMIPDFEQETIVIKEEEGINMSLVEEGMGEIIENATESSKGKSEIYKSIPVNREVISKKNIHIVVAGETLYSISKKFNLTTTQLKKMNQLEENTITIGQKLKIKE
ncbi:MAG: LysM peptidoglycan-binding domain-containing protein [Saprospiraceae bacterium]